ncbi:hypothetical protein EAI30_06415 [Romboutsia ilealis]|uniref:DUF6873 domain-containing protein n=1 Tax=Romboutsia faecis TaxID=2764597 RepID=A0ABR7JP72_9FIRM|nr:hypothetical protein [Romboutsia faecis]MBC5996721.1 hypothetical protein [Romboutsia faecis]MRN24247.1 hypothetical protein [Romboutsia ilealis]
MKYVKESFITKEKLSLAIVDKRITIDMENKLRNYNINIIKTPYCDGTYNAIKYHPDISVCKLNDNNIVVAPNVYSYYNDILSNYNFNVIKGNSTISNKYPNNIQYNVAILGNYAIHNFKYTDNIILEYLDRFNIKKINVKQGYSKCSICIVDENSLITSDEGIHKEVIKYGIDSLLIEKGYIDLFDLDYGFIGGCSGLISKDTLSFFGDIKKHPDYNKILEFVNKKNKKIVSLSNENLLDLGSLIPLCTI